MRMVKGINKERMLKPVAFLSLYSGEKGIFLFNNRSIPEVVEDRA